MRESCTYGSVRGAGSNLRPYRDPRHLAGREWPDRKRATRCERTGGNVHLRPVMGKVRGGARRHQGESRRRHFER